MGYRYTAALLGQSDSGATTNKKVGATINYVHWKSLTAVIPLFYPQLYHGRKEHHPQTSSSQTNRHGNRG